MLLIFLNLLVGFARGSNVYSEIIKSNNIVLFTIPDCR